ASANAGAAVLFHVRFLVFSNAIIGPARLADKVACRAVAAADSVLGVVRECLLGSESYIGFIGLAPTPPIMDGRMTRAAAFAFSVVPTGGTGSDAPKAMALAFMR